MTSPERVLVVGAGQAGTELAISLRDNGFTGAIVLVGCEQGQPYQRPPLSKDFLTGEIDERALLFRGTDFWHNHGIDLISGERILTASMDATGRGVGITGQGRRVEFDRLALATGARPRRLTVPGSNLDGVAYLRDLRDARSLRRRMLQANRVAVIGGGFIGLEAAAVCRGQGKAVTVLEVADRLMERSVAPVVSEFYRSAHTERGVDVLLSAEVTAIRGSDGRVTGVHLADGSVIDADLVLVGIGVIPRTELAEQLGLDCDGGIVVDELARTSRPGVVAAGDCTVQPHPLTGDGLVRLESVQNAVSQAKLAAPSLIGRAARPADVPWFWSDQYDLKLQIAGLTRGYDQLVVRGDPGTSRFSVVYYRGGRLTGVDAVNAPADYLVVRQALKAGVSLPAEAVADASVPMRSLLAPPQQLRHNGMTFNARSRP
ncbi:MAG: FAD-dependent oxidoreductase [Actinobacteria bacterium]|nr:FAD-dependent oxidoreductase [Actinomycetota bacterium]MBO0834570.1 FAD-dependent oxidoreductase [Actinomycetota bacterium]